MLKGQRLALALALLLGAVACGRQTSDVSTGDQGDETQEQTEEQTEEPIGPLAPAEVGVPEQVSTDLPLASDPEIRPCDEVAKLVDVPLRVLQNPPPGEVVCALAHEDAERPSDLPPIPRTGAVVYVPQGYDPSQHNLHEILAGGGIVVDADVLLRDPPPFPQRKEPARAAGGRAPVSIDGKRGRVYRVFPEYVHVSFYPVLEDGTRLRVSVTAGTDPDTAVEYARGLRERPT